MFLSKAISKQESGFRTRFMKLGRDKREAIAIGFSNHQHSGRSVEEDNMYVMP